MKFGLYFHRYIVPKWDEFYVDYNGLRQLMRKAAQTNAEPDFAGPSLISLACQISKTETRGVRLS